MLTDSAKLILNDPMTYLRMDHNEKTAIDPSVIYKAVNPPMQESDFVQGVNQIRYLASQKGRSALAIKPLLWECMDSLSSEIYTQFANPTRLNDHLKGLFGSELPRHLRDRYRLLFVMEGSTDAKTKAKTKAETKTETKAETKATSEEVATPVIESEGDKVLNLGALNFKFSGGATLSIGELSVKELDLKNFKSVSVQKIEDGKLYGVTLQA